MAEALGIASGAVQIASFAAEVGSALCKYSKDFRNAGSDVTALVHETDLIVKALTGLRPLLSSPEQQASFSATLLKETQEVLSGCRNVFSDLDAGLDYWKKKSENGKLPFWVRGQWPLRKARLIVLQETLSRYGQVLSLMLAVVQFAEGKKLATKHDLSQLQKQLEQLTLANQTLSRSNESLSKSHEVLSMLSVSPKQYAQAASIALVEPTPRQHDTLSKTDTAREQTGTIASRCHALVRVPSCGQDGPPKDDPSFKHLLLCKQAVEGLAIQLELAISKCQAHSEASLHRNVIKGSWDILQQHVCRYLGNEWQAANGSNVPGGNADKCRKSRSARHNPDHCPDVPQREALKGHSGGPARPAPAHVQPVASNCTAQTLPNKQCTPASLKYARYSPNAIAMPQRPPDYAPSQSSLLGAASMQSSNSFHRLPQTEGSRTLRAFEEHPADVHAIRAQPGHDTRYGQPADSTMVRPGIKIATESGWQDADWQPLIPDEDSSLPPSGHEVSLHSPPTLPEPEDCCKSQSEIAGHPDHEEPQSSLRWHSLFPTEDDDISPNAPPHEAPAQSPTGTITSNEPCSRYPEEKKRRRDEDDEHLRTSPKRQRQCDQELCLPDPGREAATPSPEGESATLEVEETSFERARASALDLGAAELLKRWTRVEVVA